MERTAREAGVHVGNNLYTDFDYADDVVLMAEQTETLRSALTKFHQTAEDLGLHPSWQKTKVQNQGVDDPAADITVANNTIEAVKSFGTWALFSRLLAGATQTYIDELKWPPPPCTRCNAVGVKRVKVWTPS